jgi:hypothetical protein
MQNNVSRFGGHPKLLVRGKSIALLPRFSLANRVCVYFLFVIYFLFLPDVNAEMGLTLVCQYFIPWG